MQLATGLLRRSIGDARRLLSGLRPPILDEEGIVLAIQYLVAEQAMPGKLEIEFTHDVQFDRLDSLLEGTMFRIVQESLNNIKRHSGAAPGRSAADAAAGNRCSLEIRDWGRGFSLAEVPPERFGLQGIRKRAALSADAAKSTARRAKERKSSSSCRSARRTSHPARERPNGRELALRWTREPTDSGPWAWWIVHRENRKNPMNLTETPEFVTWPETHYIYLEKIGPFQETAPQAWHQLLPLEPSIAERAEIKGAMALYRIEPGKMTYRAGYILAAQPAKLPEGLQYFRFKGGKYARFVLIGAFSNLPQACGRVFEIVEQTRLKRRDDFCIEHYVNDPRNTPEDQLRTEILIPVA